MEVLMEVLRVDAEVEVEMMTAATHVATEIAQMMQAVEMGTITEAVAEYAHALEAPEITIDLGGIVVIEMILTGRPEMIVEIEPMVVDKVEAPIERKPLL